MGYCNSKGRVYSKRAKIALRTAFDSGARARRNETQLEPAVNPYKARWLREEWQLGYTSKPKDSI